MPWKTICLKEQRWKFIQIYLRAKKSLAELCRQCAISRKTAYKWIERFHQNGRSALGDRSRSPHRLHNRPARRWLARVRRWKVKHPSWGAPKIHWALKRRFGCKGLPSEPAIGRWLKAWRLSRRRRRAVGAGPRICRPTLSAARYPNDVWTVDFKGWFRTGDGSKVEPLTVRDLASRYVLKVVLLPQQNVQRTQAEFEQIFDQYGLPLVIRMDNGSPFGSGGALGLSRLSAWWLKLGIKVEFIEPGRPDQNGSHEQFHRAYKEGILAPAAPTVRAQKMRSKRWCWEYNHERPHEALGMAVPAQFYRKSRHKMPLKLKPWTYPKGWKSRRVKGHGMIHLNGRGRFVGEAFENERIGLKPIGAGVWQVYFGSHLLGELWEADRQGLRPVRYRKRTRKRDGAKTSLSRRLTTQPSKSTP